VVCGNPGGEIEREHGSFADWFVRGAPQDIDLVAVDARFESLPPREEQRGFDAVIITGSPHSAYDDLPWIRQTERVARDAVTDCQPLLGVCFGHQVLAQAMGGKVIRNPRGREIGTVQVRVFDESQPGALLDGLGPVFTAQATHQDTVRHPPPGARVFARSSLDDCQVFNLGSAWGVQFHPEITAPIISTYIAARADVLRSESLDADQLLAGVRETPEAASLLARFVALSRRA